MKNGLTELSLKDLIEMHNYLSNILRNIDDAIIKKVETKNG